MIRSRLRCPALPVALFLTVVFPASGGAQNWPSFRGPGARGVADGQDLPQRWNLETRENVRWRTPIPGLGHSSPIVWGDLIFVTTAVADEIAPLQLGDTGGIAQVDDQRRHTWKVLALDVADGRVRWQKDAVSGVPRAGRHVKASQANPTPATDGKTLVAILGSEGLVAFDLDGTLRWRVDLGVLDPGFFGRPSSQWGYASSPILVDGLVVTQVDRHRDSYLAAWDAKTGERVWKVERDERPVWATPTLHPGPQRRELIVVGGYYVRGYRPSDGGELWRFADEAQVKTTTGFVAGHRIILSGGYRGRPIMALRLGGSGDLSVPKGAKGNKHLLWRTEQGGPYTSTPVAYGDYLYGVTNEGVFNVYALATGEHLHRIRTDETYSASLLASDGKIYLTGEGGTITVVAAGSEPEVLAKNAMGEPCMATPAISGGRLFVRSRSALYAISKRASRGGK